MLEPDEGKPSRPVLRRGDGSNSVSLAGEYSLSQDWLDNGEDMRSFSASIDALQTAIN
jgi:hypothetical protein